MIDLQKNVFIIDYGNAQKFLLPDGTHRPNRSEAHNFVNAHFGSKNAMNNETLSRRDDMIQIIYNLICLVNSFQPLREYIGPDTEDLTLFSKYKKKRTAKNFCYRNKTPYFTEVLNECYEMSYDATPNYEKLKFILKKIILNMNKLPGGEYCQDRTRIPSNQALDEETLIIGKEPDVSSINES